MGHRKGIIYAALERLDQLMAIGESRHAAKRAIRATAEPQTWTLSSGKMHSHITRKVYQQHTLAFLNWARATYGITRLEQVDQRADEQVSRYLAEHVASGKSPYTVQAQRSALRLFFGNRDLGASVAIPVRKRAMITRARGEGNEHHHFQPLNWPAHVIFAQASGLRRSELRDLRIRDITSDRNGDLIVHVNNGKGGRARDVPILAKDQQEIMTIIAGRQPDERVFASIPKQMSVHRYRRASAQERYLHYAPGATLPPQDRRLKRQDYDQDATRIVSHQLGHTRCDVILRHYLR